MYWLPWWLSSKNLPANGATSSVPGSGKSPGEGNGKLLQYTCLGNPMEGGEAWWPTVHGVTKESESDITKQQ